jgi:hypothetical protein
VLRVAVGVAVGEEEREAVEVLEGEAPTESAGVGVPVVLLVGVTDPDMVFEREILPELLGDTPGGSEEVGLALMVEVGVALGLSEAEAEYTYCAGSSATPEGGA